MVPWVPMMIIVYKTKMPNNGNEKYLKMNKYKNGSRQMAFNQVTKVIQFFFVLKILVFLKASLYSVATEGLTSSPFSSAQPYEGS